MSVEEQDLSMKTHKQLSFNTELKLRQFGVIKIRFLFVLFIFIFFSMKYMSVDLSSFH